MKSTSGQIKMFEGIRFRYTDEANCPISSPSSSKRVIPDGLKHMVLMI